QLARGLCGLRGLNDAERTAIALEPPYRLPVTGAMAPFEREPLEIHARLFSQLDERETKVRVSVQVPGPDLVEHGHAIEVVAPLEELSDERGLALAGANRIAERDPCVSLYAVHQEGRPALVEEQRFGPGVSEVRERGWFRPYKRIGRCQILVGRQDHFVGCRPDETGKREEHDHERGANRCAQEPRRFAAMLELPPQLVRVRHV